MSSELDHGFLAASRANAGDSTEFDFRVVGDGRSAVARYANNSNYRNDSLIRKESESGSASLLGVLALNFHRINSVRQFRGCRRDQTHHQDERDHQVRKTPGQSLEDVEEANVVQRGRFKMASQE
jgi:hypothetical protein